MLLSVIVILLLGTASEIGKSIAREFSKSGANVVLSG
jgi:NAD(P)-dependent dehydrogenase (short-subunit alcohol dehydrogenase family)